MVESICNFCGKFRKTYACRSVGVDYEYHACHKCIRTLPFQLVPMEEYHEDEAESEQEVEGHRLPIPDRTTVIRGLKPERTRHSNARNLI